MKIRLRKFETNERALYAIQPIDGSRPEMTLWDAGLVPVLMLAMYFGWHPAPDHFSRLHLLALRHLDECAERGATIEDPGYYRDDGPHLQATLP